MTAATASNPSRRSSELRAFAELFLVAGFAFAEPVLQIFAGDPSVFGRYGLLGIDIAFWALGVLLLLPVLAWSVEVVVGIFNPNVRTWVHRGLLCLGVGLWAIRVVRDATGAPPMVVLFLAAGVAVGFGFAYVRVPRVRNAMVVVCWVPALFLLGFFTSPGLWDLINGGSIADADPYDEASGPGSEADASAVDISTPTTRATDEAAADDVASRPPVQLPTLGEIDSEVPVVFVIFDGLGTWSLLDGRGNIDADTYPNFAELAEHATWYRNSTTVAPNTARAVPALVTGKVGSPTGGTIFHVSSFPESIFTWLGETYEMNVVEPVGRLCPVNICEPPAVEVGDLLSETLTQWRRSIALRPAEEGDDVVSTEDRAAAFSAWLDDLGGGATLNFHHILLPHDPLDLTDDAVRYDGPSQPEGRTNGVWRGEQAAEMGRQRYLLQVQAADAMVGQLIARMKEIGIWDDAVLVVTADHGSSFIDGKPQRGMSEENLTELIWQASFIRSPGQEEGAVSDAQVRTVDVLPTIADVLGTELPWESDGQSANAPDRQTLDTLPVLSRWAWNWVGKDADYLDVDPALFDDVVRMQGPPAGVPGDAFALYRYGEYGDLLGYDVAALQVTGTPVEGEIEDAGRWKDVDLGGGELPLYVRGTFDAAAAPRQMAIAINGRIALTAPTGDGEFWGVLPQELLVDGENEVQAYLVSGPPTAPVLAPIAES